MTDFTIIDGVYLMIVAMTTVFLILASLGVLLTLIGKLVDKYIPVPAKTPLPAAPVASAPVAQTEAQGLPPEKVALLMSIIFEKKAHEIKTKKI